MSEVGPPAGAPAGRWGWVRVGIGAAVLGLFLLLGRRHLGELHRLADASLPLVGSLLALAALDRVGHGHTLQRLLGPFGHAVRLGEAFFVANLTGFGNLFVPRSGAGAAAVHLKRRHGVALPDYAAITVCLALLDAVATGWVGLAGLALFAARGGVPVDPRLALAFAAVVLAGVAATRVRLDLLERYSGRVAGFLRSLARGWGRIGARGSGLARVGAIRLLLLLLSAARLQLAFLALGVDVPFPGVLLAAMLGTLAQLSSLTPAGIGIREAAIAYAATAIGCTPATALAAAVLDRLATSLYLGVAAPLGLWRSLSGTHRGSA